MTAGHVNRRYGAMLATILLLVPVLVTMLCDFLISMRFSWSLYVLGAGAFVFCCSILPFYMRKPRPYLSVIADAIAALLLLFLIARTSGFTIWFWRLALPLTALTGTAAIIGVWIFHRSNSTVLVKMSTMALVFAALLLCIECTIDLFVFGFIRPRWSLYVMVPLAALAGILLVINRKHRLLENIRKRLFM